MARSELDRIRELEELRENFRIRARAWGLPEWQIERAIAEAEIERVRSGHTVQ